jgi:hypothetical protein
MLGTQDDIEVATVIDNTATRGKKLNWAGAGGQFSVLTGDCKATLHRTVLQTGQHVEGEKKHEMLQ